MNVTLTDAEVRLLLVLLAIDPGPLGLSNQQAKTALALLKKLKKGEN